jgi:hypothetical protein
MSIRLFRCKLREQERGGHSSGNNILPYTKLFLRQIAISCADSAIALHVSWSAFSTGTFGARGSTDWKFEEGSIDFSVEQNCSSAVVLKATGISSLVAGISGERSLVCLW